MGAFILNEENATDISQSEVDEIDWSHLAQLGDGDGVVSGMEVTATGAQTVSVATGVVRIAGVLYSHTGPTVVNLDAAHATLARFDLIECGVSGTPTEIAGTAAALPDFPARTASTVWLAAVYRAPADNTTAAGDITDKRSFQALEGQWTGNMDADSNTLTNVGTSGAVGLEVDGQARFNDWVAIGTAPVDPQTAAGAGGAPGAGGWLVVAPTGVDSSSGGDYTMLTSNTGTITKDTAQGGILAGLFLSAGPLSGSYGWDQFYGIFFNAGWLNSGSAVSNAWGGLYRVAHLGAYCTDARAIEGRVAPVYATDTRATGFYSSVSEGLFGTVVTGVGLEVDLGANMGTSWGILVGGGAGNNIVNAIRGKTSFGANSDESSPVYGVDLQGAGADMGVIGLVESTATPTNPTASSQCILYMKGDKLVVGYDDAGTMRYKYLSLTGTGVTWTHTTTAP